MSRPIYGIGPKTAEACPPVPKSSMDLRAYIQRTDNILKQLLDSRNKSTAVERLDLLITEVRLTYPTPG